MIRWTNGERSTVSEFVDYYKVLRLPLNASSENIKRSYRQLALQYHPDRGGSPQKMSLLNEAYSILSDASLRANYNDLYRHYYSRSGQQTDETIQRTNQLVQILVNAKKSASAYAKKGAAWMVGGLIVTIVSYSMASTSGGHYLFTWGAILVGFYEFIRGMHYYFNPQLLVKKNLGTQNYNKIFSDMQIKTSWKVAWIFVGCIAVMIAIAAATQGSLSTLASDSQGSSTVKPFTSTDNTFSINFPGNPTTTNSTTEQDGSTIPYTTYESQVENDTQDYSVIEYDWPGNFDFTSLSSSDMQTALNDSLTGFVNAIGGSVSSSSYGTFDNDISEDSAFTMSTKGNVVNGFVRVFFANNYEYIITSIGASQEDFSSFAESFQSV